LRVASEHLPHSHLLPGEQHLDQLGVGEQCDVAHFRADLEGVD
jgi:hypothetical protein